MLDLNLLAQAAEKIETHQQDHLQEAEECYQDALELLARFQTAPHKTYLLTEAAELLVDSIYYKRNRVEPYLKLANIFYILDQDRLVLKYLQAAKKIQAHHPDIKKLNLLVMKDYQLAG